MKTTINIMSIFFSVSGEIAAWPQGSPILFIRFAGCNLNCPYCDTPESINSPGTKMTVDQIMFEVEKYKVKRVIITGGEPLLQREGLGLLLKSLASKGYWVGVETNGSFELAPLIGYPDFWLVDIKMPTSGQNEKMIDYERFFECHDFVPVIFKFPIENEEDLKTAKLIIDQVNVGEIMCALSPVFPMTGAELWELMKKNDLVDCIINTQIHKHIWPNSKIER